MTLETLLQANPSQSITNVFVRENLTFFKVGNESFCTAAGKIYHSSNPMFDHPVTKIWAREHVTEEGKAEHKEMIDQINTQLDLWMKHRKSCYKIVFMLALDAMVQHDEDTMMEVADEYFSITPEDACNKILERLEKGE